MLNGRHIAVVMPAYWAERTVARTVAAIPREVVDTIIVVDDASGDDTVRVASELDGVQVHRNATNRDYGGNVKRCLQLGLDAGADIVVQLHADAQYPPALVPALAGLIASDAYDLALASRATGRGPLAQGMPRWRYAANRALTRAMDAGLGTRHSEYHTGYRAYARSLLVEVDLHALPDTFLFDNALLVAALRAGFRTGEVSCPVIYDDDSSSISFQRAVRYGLGCLRLSADQARWRLTR